MAPRSTLEALSERMMQAYNTWDIDAILALRTEDCTQHSFPESLNRQPMQSRKEYEGFFRPILPLLRNFRLERISPSIIDTERNKIAMHLRVTAESDAGPYSGEYLAMYTATEDGARFSRVDEFVDTTLAAKHAAPLLGLIQSQQAK